MYTYARGLNRLLIPGFFFPVANAFNFSQGHNGFVLFIACLNLASCVALIGFPAYFGRYRLPSAMRITAICVLTISAILLFDSLNGNKSAFFPGLAALFFGVGNLLQSSSSASRYAAASGSAASVLHPAVWYGLGYTMTAIAIGGGYEFLAHPFANKFALVLITIGTMETLSACWLLCQWNHRQLGCSVCNRSVWDCLFCADGNH